MTRVTDGYGGVTRYYLNQAGQVVQIVDPLGGVTTKTFDEHGRLVGVTHPDGSKESHAYDDKGNRASSADPTGAKTQLEHNDAHMPVGLVDRNGYAWKLPNSMKAVWPGSRTFLGASGTTAGIRGDWLPRLAVWGAGRLRFGATNGSGGRKIAIRRR